MKWSGDGCAYHAGYLHRLNGLLKAGVLGIDEHAGEVINVEADMRKCKGCIGG